MHELPPTERANPHTSDLDDLSTPDLVRVLLEEQRAAAQAVGAASGGIAKAVDSIAARLERGGRLHYVGAGTSGRLGMLDASEMPPTFGTDSQLVHAHIAGGAEALVRAVEGAEDDAETGEREMRACVRADDAVVGISASGGAPYVRAALDAARAIGALTVAVTNAPDSTLQHAAEIAVVVETGAEPLTGSTRLKAGTAQKIVLNTISTAVMVRLGKTYGNLMVDVVATNAKLRSRATRLVMQLADVREDRARELLQEAGWRVKVAAVMGRRGSNAHDAAAVLERNKGSLRRSL